MDREQLIDIILASTIFQDLEPDLQNAILASEVQVLARYAKIFMDANQQLQLVYGQYTQKITGVLDEYKVEIKKVKKEKLNRDEQNEEALKQKKEQELLMELEKI